MTRADGPDDPSSDGERYEAAVVAIVTVLLRQAEREGLDPCSLMGTVMAELADTMARAGHPECAVKVLLDTAGGLLDRPVIGFAFAPEPAPTPPTSPEEEELRNAVPLGGVQ